MDKASIPEVLLFAAISVFPYYALILQPFWKRLRFSKMVTLLLLFAAYILDFFAYLSVVNGGSVVFSHVVHLAIALLYSLVVIKDDSRKIMLTYVILVNFYVIINTISTYFEGLFFPVYTMTYYRWTQSVCTIPVEAIFLAFDWVYSVRVYEPTMLRLNYDRYTSLQYLWTIPGTFLLVWAAIMFSGEGNDLTAPHNLPTVLLMSAITAGAFFTDYIIALLIKEQGERQEQDHQLFVAELKQRQYENLNARVDEARRIRHDIRHHLDVAAAYMDDGKIDELREYLNHYRQVLPNDSLARFCGNYTVNALLTYYKQRCDTEGITFKASVGIPQDITVDDQDLCVIFGNLLENAMDAAMETVRSGKEGEVSVQGLIRGNMFMLQISNTCVQKPHVDLDGQYHSTKHPGYGIGIRSVSDMAEKYNGHMDVQFNDEWFTVAVVLYLPEENKTVEER